MSLNCEKKWMQNNFFLPAINPRIPLGSDLHTRNIVTSQMDQNHIFIINDSRSPQQANCLPYRMNVYLDTGEHQVVSKEDN